MTPPRIRVDGYEGPERRREGREDRQGGGDWMGTLPVWARAIAVVGIPGAIAIFLVWVGAQEIPQINRQTQMNYEAILRNRELLMQHMSETAEVARMLQRICSNTAKDENERQRCFDK